MSTDPDEMRRLVQAELAAERDRRRREWRERLRTAAPWIALLIAAATPFVNAALTRTWP